MRATIDIPRTATGRFVEGALEGLARVAEDEIVAGDIPPLYRAGVVYQRERGTEDWLTPSQILGRGYGDCEDLAAWRVGELRATGIDPDARVVVRQTGPRTLHALVERGDGRVEDPSARLGMPTRAGMAEPRLIVGADRSGAVAVLSRRRERPDVIIAPSLVGAVDALTLGDGGILDLVARGAKGALDAVLAPAGPAPQSTAAASEDWTLAEFQRLTRQLARLVSAEARRWSRSRR